jgi:hypothetical protein
MPVHYIAALQGASSSGVLCMLLRAAADPLAVNKQRLTPVQLAQRSGHTAAAAAAGLQKTSLKARALISR